jgi:hypothetical protein
VRSSPAKWGSKEGKSRWVSQENKLKVEAALLRPCGFASVGLSFSASPSGRCCSTCGGCGDDDDDVNGGAVEPVRDLSAGCCWTVYTWWELTLWRPRVSSSGVLCRDRSSSCQALRLLPPNIRSSSSMTVATIQPPYCASREAISGW